MSLPSSNNRDRFVRETIDGETIIMDTVSGRLLLLRETAPLVLAMLDSGTPRESVLEEVSNRYGAEAETQARNFVAKLAEFGLTRALILVEAYEEKLFLAARNVPHVDVMAVASLDPLTLIKHDKVIATVGALKLLEQRLGGANE